MFDRLRIIQSQINWARKIMKSANTSARDKFKAQCYLQFKIKEFRETKSDQFSSSKLSKEKILETSENDRKAKMIKGKIVTEIDLENLEIKLYDSKIIYLRKPSNWFGNMNSIVLTKNEIEALSKFIIENRENIKLEELK